VRVSGEKKCWRMVDGREFRKVCWRVSRGLLVEEVGEVSLALEGVLSFCGFLVVGGGDFGVTLVDAAVVRCFSFLGGSLFWFAVGWLPDFLFLDFPMVTSLISSFRS